MKIYFLFSLQKQRNGRFDFEIKKSIKMRDIERDFEGA